MKKSQSGRYWNFLYSLTPMGRREMQNSPGLTTHGEESSDPCEKIDLIGDDYQTSLLETLLNDPDTFVKKGEELKTAFKNYKGTLLNYQNSKLVLNHDGITDDNVRRAILDGSSDKPFFVFECVKRHKLTTKLSRTSCI